MTGPLPKPEPVRASRGKALAWALAGGFVLAYLAGVGAVTAMAAFGVALTDANLAQIQGRASFGALVFGGVAIYRLVRNRARPGWKP